MESIICILGVVKKCYTNNFALININQHFTVLRKCKTKQDCLILGNCHPLLMSKATRSEHFGHFGGFQAGQL